ncbi:MAG: MMPL family transporter [bacterium]|nr:MMPL family transporter [bacterium]
MYTDSSRLLPTAKPFAEAHRTSRELFGETSPLLLLVQADGSTERAFDEFVTQLAEGLTNWNDTRLVVFQRPMPRTMEEFRRLFRVGLWRASPKMIDDLASGLSREKMRRQLLRTRKRLVAVDDPEVREQVRGDVLGILQRLSASLEGGMSGLRMSPTSQYLESLDGGSRIIWFQPQGFGEDSTYCIDLMNRLEALVTKTRNDVPGAEGITVRASGVHAITAESSGILLGQMVAISLVSALLLFGLLWLRFRNIRITLLCIVPLVVAQVLTLVIAGLLFNPVFAWSIGFVAIAMGLGLDVSLHLVARFVRFHCKDGPGIERATEATMRDSGPPVMVGVLSTAAAFLAILLADSPGLDQFAILTAIGLVAALGVTLVLFPVMVRLLNPQPNSVSRVGSSKSWSQRFFAGVTARKGWAASFALVVLAVSVPIAFNSRLDLSIENLIPADLESVHTGQDIVNTFGGSFLLTSQVMVRASTLEDVILGQSEVDSLLAEMRRENSIAGYRSALDELGDSVPLLPEVASSMADLNERFVNTRDQFLTLLEELGFSASPFFDEYFQVLVEATRPLEADTVEALAANPQNRLVLSTQEDGVALQSYFWPADTDDDPQGQFELDRVIEVSREVRSISLPQGVAITVTGIAEVYSRVSEMVVTDLRRISLLGGVLVVLVVSVFLRNIRFAALCFVPLLAALPASAAAAMGLAIPLAQTAPCLLAVVVGIGIDDAVHVVYRLQRGDSLKGVLVEIGPVLSLTTASTIIGFGCLALSSLQVLSSMGVNIALGVAACWFFTVFLLPWAASVLTPKVVTSSVMVSVILAVSAVASTAGIENLDDLLAKLEKRAANTQAMSCEIEQTKSLEVFKEPVHLEGTIVFMQPSYIKVELQGDENLALFSNGETIWFVDRDLDEVEELPATQRSALSHVLPGFSLSDADALRNEFDVTMEQTEAAPYRLRLLPRAESDWPYELAIVDLDTHLRIDRTEIKYRNGDTVTTLYRKWRKHKKLPLGLFTYQTPTN